MNETQYQLPDTAGGSTQNQTAGPVPPGAPQRRAPKYYLPPNPVPPQPATWQPQHQQPCAQQAAPGVGRQNHPPAVGAKFIGQVMDLPKRCASPSRNLVPNFPIALAWVALLASSALLLIFFLFLLIFKGSAPPPHYWWSTITLGLGLASLLTLPPWPKTGRLPAFFSIGLSCARIVLGILFY